VKLDLVLELALAVVLNRTAPVTMTSNRLIIRAYALRNLNKSLVLGPFAQEERCHSYCSGYSTTAPTLPMPRVTAAIPARAVGMAATANKRDAQAFPTRSLCCRDLGWHSRIGVQLWPEWTYSILSIFRFWDDFLSDFAFFDAKTTGNPHSVTIEYIKHARQCVFGV
jgi:hypothetical protein